MIISKRNKKITPNKNEILKKTENQLIIIIFYCFKQITIEFGGFYFNFKLSNEQINF